MQLTQPKKIENAFEIQNAIILQLSYKKFLLYLHMRKERQNLGMSILNLRKMGLILYAYCLSSSGDYDSGMLLGTWEEEIN